MEPVIYVFKDVAEAYELRLQANAFIAAAEAEALAKLKSGESVPAYRLKPGNNVRSIRAPENFEATMIAQNLLTLDELYDFKLKGIPALEKLFKSKGHDMALLTTHLATSTGASTLQYVGT